MAGLIESGIGAFGKALSARRERRAAKSDREARMKLLEGLDYKPMYAAEVTPTYKRTESPVARAYIESFLTGSNPDATFSGSPNARYQKSQQQAAQNAAFGTPEQRIARSQALQKETPWKVTPPTRDVRGAKAAEMERSLKYPDLAASLQGGHGEIAKAFSPDELAWLEQNGILKDSRQTNSPFERAMYREILDQDYYKRGK